MANLDDLKTAIISDGTVDAGEVDQLRNAMPPRTIDRERADILFQINDAVSGNNNDPSWPVYFSEAVASYVVDDEATPGVVSDEEAGYIKDRIDRDGKVDVAERALLERLRAKAQQPVPAELTGLFDKYLA